eukprot:m51a1_g10322 hypothetical protein (208) ;mRNA; f:47681-48451
MSVVWETTLIISATAWAPALLPQLPQPTPSLHIALPDPRFSLSIEENLSRVLFRTRTAADAPTGAERWRRVLSLPVSSPAPADPAETLRWARAVAARALNAANSIDANAALAALPAQLPRALELRGAAGEVPGAAGQLGGARVEAAEAAVAVVGGGGRREQRGGVWVVTATSEGAPVDAGALARAVGAPEGTAATSVAAWAARVLQQ